MRAIDCICLLIVALAFSARADSFEAGNQAYDAGKFGEAKQHYESVVEAGEWSANLFYNLGNVDFRLGSVGRAILNYERALALDRSHPEAKANLTLLRERSAARVPQPAWFDRLVAPFSANALAILGAAAFWVGVAMAVRLKIGRPASGAVWLVMFSLFLTAIYAAASIWRIEQDRDLAIITARETDARLAPADRAKVAEKLPGGSRVRVLSERGAWTYCELPGKGRGWVPSGTLERVRIHRA